MRTIVWDVDDVLNNLTELWLEDWRHNHPETVLKYGSITENPPHKLVDTSFEEYLDSLDRIRTSVEQHERLVANPIVLDWLRKYGADFRHIALTARPHNTVGAASCWVLNHFGAWIQTFAFIPVRQPQSWPSYNLTKVDYLQWLNIDAVLIDNSEPNIAGVVQRGRPAILFPQPWNACTLEAADVLNQLVMCNTL